MKYLLNSISRQDVVTVFTIILVGATSHFLALVLGNFGHPGLTFMIAIVILAIIVNLGDGFPLIYN